MTDLIATMSAVWDGKQATQKAQNDIKGVGSSTSDLALQQQIAADKSAKFTQKTKELSAAIAKGEKTFDSAEKELSDYRKELGMGEVATDKSKRSMTGLVSSVAGAGAVLVGAGVAAKQAYDYIGEGAALSAAQGKFDNLSVSINTTGDALLGKMRDATKGMISDAVLVASGTDIMSLGLAKTESGVIRMSAAVGALDLDMQVLALTMANDSTARLDNLGLSLEAVTKKKKELIASGFIGDAFDEAVLIELEAKMTLLGDASETTAGKMKILEANQQNLRDSAKLLVAESGAVQETFSRWANLASGLTSVIQANKDAQEDMNRAVAAGFLTQDELNGLMGEDYSIALKDVRERLEALDSETQAADSIMLGYTATIEAAIPVVDRLAQDTGNLGDKARQSAQHLTTEEAAIRAGNLAIEGTVEARRIAREAIEEHNRKILEQNGVIEGASSILEGYQALIAKRDGQETFAENQQIMNDSLVVSEQKATNLELKLLGLDAEFYPEIFVDIEQPIADVGELETKITTLTSEEHVAVVLADTAEGLESAQGLESFLKGFSATTFTPKVSVDTSSAEAKIRALAEQLGSLGAARAVTDTDTSGLAAGGEVQQSGVYTVGETGTERVFLPQGARVQNSLQYNQQQYTINTNDVGGYLTQLDRQSRRL